jgi:ribosomal protein S17
MLASIRSASARSTKAMVIRRERIVMRPLFRKTAKIRRDFVHQNNHALFQLD